MQQLDEVVELFYHNDLPSPACVNAESHLWQVKWQGKEAADVEHLGG